MRKGLFSVVFGAALAMTVNIVEKAEGIKYHPYIDIAGVKTVCAGITGSDVVWGKTYTESECKALLVKHLTVAKNEVDRSVKVAIPDSMRASLYDFTYNVGTGSFRKSTLLKKVNRGDLQGACQELYSWVYFTNPKTNRKEFSRGLKNRRTMEYGYCVKDLK